MLLEHKTELIAKSKENIKDEDPSHDFLHAVRILNLSEAIAGSEGGDSDIIVPAALFHDVVIYPKNDPRSPMASIESAALARKILTELAWFPKDKIEAVAKVIERCSFSKNLQKERLEEYIVQDADLLESLGAIAVARTFSSSGQLGRFFYELNDPRGSHRELNAKKYALDLFGTRLFQAKERLHTKTAKQMAERREKFLHVFYEEFLKDVEVE